MSSNEPFTWNTPASRAFLRALMNEVEAEAAKMPDKPSHRMATIRQLVEWEKKVESLYDACAKARSDTYEALDALRSEMQEEVWSKAATPSAPGSPGAE